MTLLTLLMLMILMTLLMKTLLMTLLTQTTFLPLLTLFSLCRRLLKLYGSCEFAPLLTTEAGQSSRVLERIPIPVLHTVKLGPTNHLVGALEEVSAAR